MSALERRLTTQLESNQATVRAIADTLESGAGAAISGFISGHMGERGTKIGAIGGAAITVIGAMMDQPDVASFGRGAMCGGVALYFHNMGAKAKSDADKLKSQEEEAKRLQAAEADRRRGAPSSDQAARDMEAEHPSDDPSWDELARRRRERAAAGGRG